MASLFGSQYWKAVCLASWPMSLQGLLTLFNMVGLDLWTISRVMSIPNKPRDNAAARDCRHIWRAAGIHRVEGAATTCFQPSASSSYTSSEAPETLNSISFGGGREKNHMSSRSSKG